MAWTGMVSRREVGAISNRAFSSRLAYSQDMVLRLKVSGKLDMLHEEGMTAVSFNAGGDTLVTGTSDMDVVIWDWESGKAKLSFPSYHHRIINHAKFMPFSQDCSIVTCASDGQVRHAQILEGGNVQTELLTKHGGKVHGLAIEPGSPHVLYTCGGDGMVHRIDLRRRRAAETFNRSFKLEFPLSSIAIDPRNPHLFAIGGVDHPFAQLYDVRKCNWTGSNRTYHLVESFCPEHISDRGITGLAFSNESELLVSYIHEYIYLFSKDMGMMRPASSALSRDSAAEGPTVFRGHGNSGPGYGVKFMGPKCDYVMTGSICGRIFIWKKKSGELIQILQTDRFEVNCIESHPHIAVLASGTEKDVKVWTPTATEKAILPAYDYKDRYFAFDGMIPQYYAYIRRYGNALSRRFDSAMNN